MNNKAIANLGCLFFLILTLLACTKQNQQALKQRWTAEQANEWYDEFRGSYNLYYATDNKINDRYSEWKFAGRFPGHGTPFKTKDGKWWCTTFITPTIQRIAQTELRIKT